MGKASRNKGAKKYRGRTFVCDFDDFCDATIDELDILRKLKGEYPNFKATLFTIPMRTRKTTINTALGLNIGHMNKWIQLAPHGWFHTRGECLGWSKDEAVEKIQAAAEMGIDAPVFRAPAWLLDGNTYLACEELGYTIATHEEYRIPSTGVKEYVYNDVRYRLKGTRGTHGHMTNTSDNYIRDMDKDGRLTFPTTNKFIFPQDAHIVDPIKKRGLAM